MLTGLGIAALLCTANLVMSHRIRLIGVALLLMPQLYVPGFPLSLAVVWTLTTCLAGLTTRGRSRADSPIVVIFGIFLTATALSLLWALPSGIYVGVVNVGYSLLFLLWLREVIVLARDSPEMLDTIMVWTIPGVAIQSLLAIIFQISPGIEGLFLRSRLAAVLLGPAVTLLYSDAPNNVLSPEKSGGLFINGNVASLFGGVAALLLCIAARRSTDRRLYAFAALSISGAIFTGSKTGIIIGLGCSIALLFLPHILRKSVWLIVLYLPLLPLGYFLATDMIERFAPGFYVNTDSSYGTRQRLWTRAAELLQESPILGLGFGGWVEQVGKIGSRDGLPPHNYLLATWVNSGIVALAFALAFIIAVISLAVRVTAAQPTVRDRRTGVLASCAIAWVFLHGLGDNTGICGEKYTMILFAIAIGYLYAIRAQHQENPVIAGEKYFERTGLHSRATTGGLPAPASPRRADTRTSTRR